MDNTAHSTCWVSFCRESPWTLSSRVRPWSDLSIQADAADGNSRHQAWTQQGSICNDVLRSSEITVLLHQVFNFSLCNVSKNHLQLGSLSFPFFSVLCLNQHHNCCWSLMMVFHWVITSSPSGSVAGGQSASQNATGHFLENCTVSANPLEQQCVCVCVCVCVCFPTEAVVCTQRCSRNRWRWISVSARLS